MRVVRHSGLVPSVAVLANWLFREGSLTTLGWLSAISRGVDMASSPPGSSACKKRTGRQRKAGPAELRCAAERCWRRVRGGRGLYRDGIREEGAEPEQAPSRAVRQLPAAAAPRAAPMSMAAAAQASKKRKIARSAALKTRRDLGRPALHVGLAISAPLALADP